jgi:asparagine synthase (glutamine-hydrolysing)
MCGLLLTRGLPSSVEDKFLSALRLMGNRGPDNTSSMNFGNLKMGHNRLAIWGLGLENNQPYFSADGRYVLLFNGAIYNWRELARDYNFGDATADTVVVMMLWQKLGPNFLKCLNGMFAIVIVDLESESIFAARDRLGIKPLYFSRLNGVLAIASEIGAILELGVSDKHDDYALEVFRNLRFWPEGRTMYKYISEVIPGHYMIDGKSHAYWVLERKFETPPSDEEFEYLLSDSIAIRSNADAPVAGLISGGIDSAAIAAFSKISDFWCVGMQDGNEFMEAESVTNALGKKLHTLEIGQADFETMREAIVRKYRIPALVPNQVLLTLLSGKIKEAGFKVVLSGEGADELLDGYDRVFDWSKSSANLELNEFAELYAYTSSPNLEVIESELSVFGGNTYEIVSRLFINRHLRTLVERADKASMFYGVETRAPFLDYRLVDRLFLVDSAWKNHNVSKAPLRRIAAPFLGASNAQRPKLGFPVITSIGHTADKDKRASIYDHWFEKNMSVFRK